MLTIAQIAERYGFTERQVRWRLAQLDGLLTAHVFTGVNGRVLLDDAGLTIFDRLVQLERDGLSLSTAVSRLTGEIGQTPTASARSPSVTDTSTTVTPELWERLIQEKDARIAQLMAENAWLRAKLDETLSRLPALPPPTPSISRWRALRIALLGR